MRYSIGDVSRMLGMTTVALHFYEKEGIIDTPKEESGRRYYEEADINRLISAKKYREMDVAVRDIARQFSSDGMTGEQVIGRMRDCRERALAQAAHYAGLARDIERLITLGEAGMRAENAVDIRPAPDMLAFCNANGTLMSDRKCEQEAERRWLEALPAVSISILREKTDASTVFALMLPLARARELGLDEGQTGVRVIPGGMALHAVTTCGEEQYEQPGVIFRPIEAFAREHRFTQCGGMWGSVLFVDCSDGVRRHFYDTYMRIR